MAKTITEKELRSSDGLDGRPIYVAYDGKVYDVSGSKLWRKGQHVRRHHAGHDLTTDLSTAPHDASVFEREHIMLVGELPAVETAEEISGLQKLLDFYFGLHPHPVSVHFPIAYLMGLIVLLLLFLVTGSEIFDTVAYYLLWMGVVMTPVAMLAGAISWWFNFGHKFTSRFRIKLGVSISLFVVGVVALILRTTRPAAFIDREPVGWAYFGLVLLMVAMVAVLGWIGARISLPPRKRN